MTQPEPAPGWMRFRSDSWMPLFIGVMILFFGAVLLGSAVLGLFGIPTGSDSRVAPIPVQVLGILFGPLLCWLGAFIGFNWKGFELSEREGKWRRLGGFALLPLYREERDLGMLSVGISLTELALPGSFSSGGKPYLIYAVDVESSDGAVRALETTDYAKARRAGEAIASAGKVELRDSVGGRLVREPEELNRSLAKRMGVIHDALALDTRLWNLRREGRRITVSRRGRPWIPNRFREKLEASPSGVRIISRFAKSGRRLAADEIEEVKVIDGELYIIADHAIIRFGAGMPSGALEPLSSEVRRALCGREGDAATRNRCPITPLSTIGTTRLRHGDYISDMTCSPDGSCLATSGNDGFIRIWDQATGDEIRAILVAPYGSISMAWIGDGSVIAAPSKWDGGQYRVRFWNSATGDMVRDTNFGHFDVEKLAATPDGHRLGVIEGASFRIRDLETDRWIEMDGSLGIGGDYSLAATHGTFATALLEIALWDAATGARIRTIHPPKEILHRGGVRCIAFSPRGDRLAAGCADGMMRIWDVATGEEARPPIRCEDLPARDRHGLGVSFPAIAWSPDGRLAAIFGDRKIAIRDGETFELIGEGKASTLNWPTRITFLPHERFALADGCRIYIRDQARPSEDVLGPTGMDRECREFDVAVDGRVACSVDSSPRLWSALTGEAIVTPDGRGTTRISPDGRFLAWRPGDRVLCVRELASTAPTREFSVPLRNNDLITDFCFSPDGGLVAVASLETVRLVSSRSGEVTSVLRRPWLRRWLTVRNLAWSPDGRRVALTSEFGRIDLWDLESDRLRRISAHGGKVHFSHDGRMLAVCGGYWNSRWIGFWVAKTGEEAGLIDMAPVQGPDEVAFLPDGRLIAYGMNRESFITIRSVPDGEIEARVPIREGTHAMQVETGGDLLVAGCSDGIARVFRWGEGK